MNILAMHMADALISPQVGGIMLVVAIALLIFSAKKSSEKFDELNIPLMGVLGAFVFAGQMINFTIPATGSSGHIAGGILLASLLGAYPAFIALACVLLIQAFFFADGGILALGCNIFNMAFFTCLIAYPLIFVPIVKKYPTKVGIFTASILSCVISLQLGAFCVVLETLCSGISDLPFATFVSLMQPIHIAIALVEGVLTASVIVLLKNARPQLFESVKNSKFTISKKMAVASVALASLVIGGGISQIASENPDGLEWSIAKTTNSEEELASPETVAHKMSANIQEKTSILPDYAIKDSESPIGTSISGIVGGILCVVFLFLIAQVIKLLTLKKKNV